MTLQEISYLPKFMFLVKKTSLKLHVQRKSINKNREFKKTSTLEDIHLK